MFSKFLKLGAVCLLGVSSVLLTTEAKAATSLPNGASSLSESYQAWSLSCATIKGANRCAVQQQVWNVKPRQRLLSISFQPEGMQMRGTALVPFGVDLSKGFTILADGSPAGEVFPFSTCLPEGCIVPLDLSAVTLKKMEKAEKLEISINAIGGREMKFPLSPKGLEEAMKRATSLTK